jgi:hypothetical protein
MDEPQNETESTGAVRNKLYPMGAHFPARYDLLLRNAEAMKRLAETFGEGFDKYGADNWMKGFKESMYLSHGIEHLRLYAAGDASEDHLAHATWNLMALMWVQANRPDLLDLTKPQQAI